MSLNLMELLQGRKGAGYRNVAESLPLLDKGYGLYVTKDKTEGILRPLKGNGGKPVPVYRRSFLALIHNRIVVKDGTDGKWERYVLPV